VRRLLVLALVLAGCGGAATAPAPELRKVDDFPLYELTTTSVTPSVFAKVDISYLGFDRHHLEGVSAAGLQDASRLPFDGMNPRAWPSRWRLCRARGQVPGARPARSA
jgi:hypothetical protein